MSTGGSWTSGEEKKEGVDGVTSMYGDKGSCIHMHSGGLGQGVAQIYRVSPLPSRTCLCFYTPTLLIKIGQHREAGKAKLCAI